MAIQDTKFTLFLSKTYSSSEFADYVKFLNEKFMELKNFIKNNYENHIYDSNNKSITFSYKKVGYKYTFSIEHDTLWLVFEPLIYSSEKYIYKIPLLIPPYPLKIDGELIYFAPSKFKNTPIPFLTIYSKDINAEETKVINSQEEVLENKPEDFTCSLTMSPTWSKKYKIVHNKNANTLEVEAYSNTVIRFYDNFFLVDINLKYTPRSKTINVSLVDENNKVLDNATINLSKLFDYEVRTILYFGEFKPIKKVDYLTGLNDVNAGINKEIMIDKNTYKYQSPNRFVVIYNDKQYDLAYITKIKEEDDTIKVYLDELRREYKTPYIISEYPVPETFSILLYPTFIENIKFDFYRITEKYSLKGTVNKYPVGECIYYYSELYNKVKKSPYYKYYNDKLNGALPSFYLQFEHTGKVLDGKFNLPSAFALLIKNVKVKGTDKLFTDAVSLLTDTAEKIRTGVLPYNFTTFGRLIVMQEFYKLQKISPINIIEYLNDKQKEKLKHIPLVVPVYISDENNNVLGQIYNLVIIPKYIASPGQKTFITTKDLSSEAYECLVLPSNLEKYNYGIILRKVKSDKVFKIPYISDNNS